MHSMWTGTVFENRLVKNVYDRTTLIILSITDTLRQRWNHIKFWLETREGVKIARSEEETSNKYNK